MIVTSTPKTCGKSIAADQGVGVRAKRRSSKGRLEQARGRFALSTSVAVD